MHHRLHHLLKQRTNRRDTQRFIFMTIILISLTVSSLHIPIHQAKRPSSTSLDIWLDCENISGQIRSFGNINCGPLPNPNIKNAYILTQQYKETGIDFVRTHDFSGPTDINMIFTDFTADPTNPLNYNFTETDRYITSIIDADCQVFYRLGNSASTNNSLRQPPNDFTKWAEICKHIAMHYNDGWNNGFHYNITYWEIWNEPDLNGFWNGTAEQYYQLYRITYETLKSYDPSLRIGGPCTSSLNNTNFTSGFLSFLQERNIHLDFYSWHMYADSPNQLYNGAIYVRTLLDSYGFHDAKNINTEWNINILTPQRDKDNMKNAAFTTGALNVFQDATIDLAFRYRATQDNNWLLRFIGFDLSLFTVDGIYKTPALSYLVMHTLLTDTPLRISTEKMTGEEKITYLGSISEDRSNISLLASNFKAETTTCTVTLYNLPWNTPYSYVEYCIDDSHHLEITHQQQEMPTTHSFSLTLPPSTIYYIRLTNSTIIPAEGPPVASIPFFLRCPLFDSLARLAGIAIMLILFG